MKVFGKKYGLWIEWLLLVFALVLMIYYGIELPELVT